MVKRLERKMNMNEITQLTSGKELIVRKKVAAFIEKIFLNLGFSFSHDRYKHIIYSEESYETEIEKMLKDYYDAYLYLLMNHKNPFNGDVINKMLFIINGKLPDEGMVIRMKSVGFEYLMQNTLDSIITFHLKMYEEMVDLDDTTRLVVSLMLLNYGLLKLDIPTFKFLKPEFNKYLMERDKYLKNGDTGIYEHLHSVLLNNKYQLKDYYAKLVPLEIKDIVEGISLDKEYLNHLGIEAMGIFGSFAKGNSRIDSDIDLVFRINEDISNSKRDEIIENLKERYFRKFHRFIDFMEVGQYKDDKFLNEVNKMIIIFKKGNEDNE